MCVVQANLPESTRHPSWIRCCQGLLHTPYEHPSFILSMLSLLLLYRLWGTSHIELPCNEVTGPEAAEVAGRLSTVARNYFQSLVMDAHSFQKPTFQLGLGNWAVTNILPDGAHERTLGRVQLLPNGAAGFSRVGDRACFDINVSG